MALSKADRAYYEEKLTLKSFAFVFLYTTIMGTIAAPLLWYIQDASAGEAGRWSLNIIGDWATIGFLLGSVVAVVLYLAFKFLLEVGWLPARHQ